MCVVVVTASFLAQKQKQPLTTNTTSRRQYIGARRIDVLLPRNLSATIRGAKSRALALPDWMLQAPFDRLQHIKRAGGGALLAAPILQSKPGRFRPPTKMGRYRCIPSGELLRKAKLMRHREAIERSRRKKTPGETARIRVPGLSNLDPPFYLTKN